jgi:hypothetical protein
MKSLRIEAHKCRGKHYKNHKFDAKTSQFWAFLASNGENSLFDLSYNLVSYRTDLAVLRFSTLKTAIFSGSCPETEVSGQLY